MATEVVVAVGPSNVLQSQPLGDDVAMVGINLLGVFFRGNLQWNQI